jgi:hypothetical protein
VEPRGPDGIDANVRGRETRLQAPPDSTGQPTNLPDHLRVNWKGLPVKVFRLRRSLYLKAKREPAFRFYSLYEAVCRPDVLRAAWVLVADNDGAPGVDGLSIEQVQESVQGVSGFLGEIEQSLKDRTYRPQPVKRVYIPPSTSSGSATSPTASSVPSASRR